MSTTDGAPVDDDPSRPGADRTRGLGRRTLTGLVWTSLGVGSSVVLQTVVLAILARLVDPNEFGLVSAALVVVNLSILFTEVGLGPAIVQRETLSPAHVRVALTSYIVLGAAMWALVAWTAPAIARFYDIPRLVPILQVIAAVFLVRNLTVGDYLLQREMHFRRLAMIDLFSFAVGYGVVSVTLAFRGWGAWAIVAGHVCQACLRTLLLWVFRPHPWLPTFARRPLLDLLGYGGGHTLARLLGYVASQGDNFVVGRWLGPVALGLYGRAYQMMVMPSLLFGRIVNQVLFPAMAAVHDNTAKLRRAYTSIVGVLAVLMLPTSLVAAIVSEELILVLLGRDWLPLQGAFNVIVLGMLFRTSFRVSDCLAQATGAVYRRAGRTFVYAFGVVGGALIGQNWGIVGVAVAILAVLTVNFLLMAQLSLSLVDMSWRDFALAHVPAALTSALMCGAAWPAAEGLRSVGAPPFLVVLGATAAAVLVGVLANRGAPIIPGLGSLARLMENVRVVMGDGRGGRIVRRLLGPRYGRRTLSPMEGADFAK
ncbi:lipopolysaccharide biosynthesis protein [soil metagenome]